jgi:hypothetical protein
MWTTKHKYLKNISSPIMSIIKHQNHLVKWVELHFPYNMENEQNKVEEKWPRLALDHGRGKVLVGLARRRARRHVDANNTWQPIPRRHKSRHHVCGAEKRSKNKITSSRRPNFFLRKRVKMGKNRHQTNGIVVFRLAQSLTLKGLRTNDPTSGFHLARHSMIPMHL